MVKEATHIRHIRQIAQKHDLSSAEILILLFLSETTLETASDWSGPLSAQVLAKAVGTAERYASACAQRLQQLGVIEALNGAEARKRDIKRPSGTHPGTHHYRLAESKEKRRAAAGGR